MLTLAEADLAGDAAGVGSELLAGRGHLRIDSPQFGTEPGKVGFEMGNFFRSLCPAVKDVFPLYGQARQFDADLTRFGSNQVVGLSHLHETKRAGLKPLFRPGNLLERLLEAFYGFELLAVPGLGFFQCLEKRLPLAGKRFLGLIMPAFRFGQLFIEGHFLGR